MQTIRQEIFGKATVRLVQIGKEYAGVIIVDGNLRYQTKGPSPDEVWTDLRSQIGKVGEDFFGFDGAIARFIRIFPGGFASPSYLDRERRYKVRAKEQLEEISSPERALTVEGLGEALLTVFRATNLLSPIESARLHSVLKSGDANSFVQGAAAFTLGDLERGIAQMKMALTKHRVATWPAATYLPFLWRPETHMFLKPEVTKDFAARVGDPFAHTYSPGLTAPVYKSLLDLTGATEAEISDLRPRDRIDVQSLIWVVGKYAEDYTQSAARGEPDGGPG